MKNEKFYLSILIILLLQACGNSKIASISKEKTISITTLGVTKEWQADPILKNWSDAKSYCSKLNTDGLQWKLPSPKDFFELLDDNKSIDSHFPNNDNYETEAHIKEFWTSTQTSFDPNKAWKINAWSSTQTYTDKNIVLGVRCVSGESSEHNFTKHISGYWIDTNSTNHKKLWTDNQSCTILKTFDEAQEFCQKTFGRIPTIFELQNTLENVDFNNKSKDFSSYWSITPLPTNETSYLTLNLMTGGISSSNKNAQNYIRCVADDKQTPIITLNGKESILITKGTPYIESNATAWDNVDGDVSNQIIINPTTINTNSIGDHTINYTVSDSSGNEITKIRHVKIIASNYIPHEIATNAINPIGLEIADINNDGYKDIISGSSAGKLATWYKNIKDLNFQEQIIDSNNNDALISITTGDIDSDNDIDIEYLTTNNLVTCFFSNATFTCTPIPNNFAITYIKLIDYDNDGDPDFVASSDANYKIVITKNENSDFQNINFSPQNTIGPLDFGYFDDKTHSFHMAQLDKNSMIDLVFSSNANHTIFKHDDSGSHEIETSIPDITINTANLYDSKYADIIVTKSDEILWKRNKNSDGGGIHGFDFLQSIATLTNPVTASGADMDNDDNIDIISASSELNGEIIWYKNKGTGTNNRFETTKNTIAYANNVKFVVTDDMDGDGDIDIVTNQEDGKIILYENMTIQTKQIRKLPKTGQVESELDFDDGYYENGTDRDYTRDDINETITQHSTNLIWQDDYDAKAVKEDWTNAKNYCQNKSNGWRLPNVYELYYLLDKGTNQAIDTTFQNIDNDTYWTSNLELDPYRTYIDFANATQHYEENYKQNKVRCVKGDPIVFIFNRNNTLNVVMDSDHDLMWEDTNNVETRKKQKLSEALEICESLTLGGFDNWRLPNINELFSTMDPNTKTNPSSRGIFKHSNSEDYWSSTSYHHKKNKIYTLNFYFGYENLKNKNSKSYFRCVRNTDNENY